MHFRSCLEVLSQYCTIRVRVLREVDNSTNYSAALSALPLLHRGFWTITASYCAVLRILLPRSPEDYIYLRKTKLKLPRIGCAGICGLAKIPDLYCLLTLSHLPTQKWSLE